METKVISTIKGHARVDVADVLRGLAVMGIIILHSIEHFNFYSFPDTTTQSDWLNFTDKAIWNGLFFMFGGKAYAVFALLFGFSFFIQNDNQRMRGNDFRLRFCWRLILLFLIGNINASFFTAEVLVLYSLVGFILPLTCRLKDKWDIPSRLRAIDTAFATLLCNTCLPGPVFHYSGHSHPQLLGCHLCRTKSWFVFGNSPGEFMGRTNSQSCLGMGSRTCIPNGSFVFVGYVNRTTRTIPKRELEGME